MMIFPQKDLRKTPQLVLLLTECPWPGPWTLLKLGTEVLLAFKQHDPDMITHISKKLHCFLFNVQV